jgi:hypothetical protein
MPKIAAPGQHHVSSCPSKVLLNRDSTGGQITGNLSQKMQSVWTVSDLKMFYKGAPCVIKAGLTTKITTND